MLQIIRDKLGYFEPKRVGYCDKTLILSLQQPNLESQMGETSEEIDISQSHLCYMELY